MGRDQTDRCQRGGGGGLGGKGEGLSSTDWALQSSQRRGSQHREQSQSYSNSYVWSQAGTGNIGGTAL